VSEENISVEELEKMLKELAEKQKETVAVVPQLQVLQQLVPTVVSEERKEEPSFEELAKKFEELANRLDFVEKAMTKGLCYHVRLPFAKDEEYATVCHYHNVDEQTAKLLTDLLFKYYKHAIMALQAIDELDECDSYPPDYHVVMFTDPIRLAVLYPNEVYLTFVFKLQENEYPEVIRVVVDVDENSKLRFRSICKVADHDDLFYVKASLLDALDMPLHIEDENSSADNYLEYQSSSEVRKE